MSVIFIKKSILLKTLNTVISYSSSPHWNFNSLIAQCSSIPQLQSLHAQILLRGLAGDAVSISQLISFCALSPSGDIRYAHKLFDEIPQPNRHIYNTLIRAYSNRRSWDSAISLYHEMVNSGIYPNEFTFPFILKACAFRRGAIEGVSIHLHAVKLGYFESHLCVQNALINFYVGCGKIELSKNVFDLMEFRSLVSWNSIIAGYAKSGCSEEAFALFNDMKEEGFEPDGHTVVSLLSVCSKLCNIEFGRFVHWYIEINGGVVVDVYVRNALLDMYAKCRQLDMAELVFARIVDKNVVSWTSMLSVYAKLGFVESAERIFRSMPTKNVVSWNSMLSCYLQNGLFKECVELFYIMCDSRAVPDETTMVSVFSACGKLGDVVTGKKLHDYLFVNGIQPSVTLSNSLIDMYAKCGSPEMALGVFTNIREKNIVSWNTMINALALNGCGYKAIEVFQEMETDGMIRPDGVTFSAVLSACCHTGLVEIGRYFFSKMGQMYKIPYDIEHYACMIDILGRGGLFDEALELVGKMGVKVKPDVVIWGTLLGACRIHRNVPVAKLVLKQVLEMEQYTGGLYVLVSNIFCEAEKWDEMRKMRKLMKEYGVRKSDAVSSVEVGGRVHEFMVDDKKHEDSSFIDATLNQMTGHLKSESDACGPIWEFVDVVEI